MNEFERRLAALENFYLVKEEATLSLIIQASKGLVWAQERLAQCDPNSPIIVLILEAHYGYIERQKQRAMVMSEPGRC